MVKAYVMVSGAFTQRAFSHVPSTWKARIAFLRYECEYMSLWTNWTFFTLISFLYAGLICYFHWEAMLISEIATRVTRIPINNMKDILESDYKVLTLGPGSFQWDSFKYGNELRKQIFADKMEPYEQDFKNLGNC